MFYDARNQLIDFNGQASFAYDHDGRRIAATANAVTTNYLWDEFSRYGDVVLETGANTVSYTLANGMVLSQTNNGVTHYLLPDAQNSTRALTDDAGLITDTFDYSAFGELIDRTGTSEANYLYTGQQYDAVSELYSLRARYYDASIGRFLSRDTWAYDYQNPVELNRYVYTANNPATWSDPSGYTTYKFTFTVAGGGAGFSAKALGVAIASSLVAIPVIVLLMTVKDIPSWLRYIEEDLDMSGLGGGNNNNPDPQWDRLLKLLITRGTGLGLYLCALFCPKPERDRHHKPEPTPDAVTPTPTPQATATSTPTQKPREVVRHYTTESAYASITSTGRYIFDASQSTDNACKGRYCLFFARGDATFPMDEAGLKFFGLSSDYAQHQFHPVMIWLRYAVGNRSFEEVRNNEDLWPKCFIELDRNKVLPENMWSYRNLGQPNEEHIYGTNSSIVDVTDAVVRSGPVSALDPNPALPQVPSSSCSGGIKRAS